MKAAGRTGAGFPRYALECARYCLRPGGPMKAYRNAWGPTAEAPGFHPYLAPGRGGRGGAGGETLPPARTVYRCWDASHAS